MTNLDLGREVGVADDVTVTSFLAYATRTDGSGCNSLGMGVAVVCALGAAVAAATAEPFPRNYVAPLDGPPVRWRD